MRNYIQEGDCLTVTAPYALTSGQGALVGGRLFGVAASDAASGAEVVINTEGVYDLTALATDTGVAGTPWYWDNTNRRLTTTASTHQAVGIGVGVKANGDATARIRLVLGLDKA
jgi:predicted RecA/RadA family phage recombinase